MREAVTSARGRPRAAVALWVALVGLAMACMGVLLPAVPAAAQGFAPPPTSPTQHVLSAYTCTDIGIEPDFSRLIFRVSIE